MATLNLDRLKTATQGDQELAAELASLFIGDVQVQLGALRSAVESQDLGQVADIAHRLKGSSSNLGAEQLCHLCAALEANGLHGVEGGLSAQLGEIQSEFALVRRELEAVASSKS